MANLTLRQATPGVGANPDYTYKSGPLTHNELDANFIALDSAQKAGFLDSGLTIGGGDIVLVEGGIELNGGDLTLNTGDIHYRPALRFHDQIEGADRMRLDSTGSLLIGSNVNSQSTNLKVSRTGNQHVLFGSKVSNSGQTTTLELGPGGDGTETGAGIRVSQNTTNFNDWAMFLFTSNGTDGHTDAIGINTNGNVDFKHDVTFDGSVTIDGEAELNGGVTIDGNLEITGDITTGGGNPIASGTVTSVGMTTPTGLSVDNSPITTSGSLDLTFDSGYSLVSAADRTLWTSGAGGIGDAPSDGDDYVRNNGSWVVAEYSSYSAGNGITMDGNNQFSLSGSTTGEFEANTRISVKALQNDGWSNAHFYMKDMNDKDRAILYWAPAGATNNSLSLTIMDAAGNSQGVFNSHYNSWTRLFYAGDERLTTQTSGVFVNGTVGSSRISMASDSMNDSGTFTPMVTAVDLGRAFKRLRTAIQGVSTFDSLQSNMDSALNEMQNTYQSYSGLLDSTDSMGSYGIV